MKAALNTFMDFVCVGLLLLLAEGAIALKRMLDEKRKRTQKRKEE